MQIASLLRTLILAALVLGTVSSVSAQTYRVVRPRGPRIHSHTRTFVVRPHVREFRRPMMRIPARPRYYQRRSYRMGPRII